MVYTPSRLLSASATCLSKLSRSSGLRSEVIHCFVSSVILYDRPWTSGGATVTVSSVWSKKFNTLLVVAVAALVDAVAVVALMCCTYAMNPAASDMIFVKRGVVGIPLKIQYFLKMESYICYLGEELTCLNLWKNNH